MMNNNIEIWKDIPGYEGLYKASNLGKIKRLSGKGCKQDRVLSQRKTNRKYMNVLLYKNNKRKTYRVHKLILEAFIGPCPINMESCHNDGDPENNFIKNLRYDTHKNNMKDQVKHGTTNTGSKNPNAKANEWIVRIVKKMFLKKELTLKEIGNIFGLTRYCIKQIKSGRTWKNVN